MQGVLHKTIETLMKRGKDSKQNRNDTVTQECVEYKLQMTPGITENDNGQPYGLNY